MKLYLIRHGESIANRVETDQSMEVSLSENGIEQAKMASKKLAGLKIDVIYSSTHLRAKQTAEVISRKINKPIEYWEDLIEADMPKESFSYLNQRSKKILEHLISHHKNQSVVCVSHATMVETIIAKMIFEDSLSYDILEAIRKHFGTTNTGISICEFTEKEEWILQAFNDSSHL